MIIPCYNYGHFTLINKAIVNSYIDDRAWEKILSGFIFLIYLLLKL